MTVLHLAAMHGRAGLVELLCAVPGADAALALRNAVGKTPLALAVERGKGGCAAVLRAHGAS